jgi:hypothetical protein
VKIKLSSREMHECQILGQDTVKICKIQNLSPRLDTPDENRVLSNVQGFRAEYAVAKIFGCDLPTLNVVTDGGVDLWIDDLSVDVKLTKKPDGDLIFDSFDSFKADISILVALTDVDNVVDILGWIDKSNFESVAQDRDYGYGSRKVVESVGLHPIETLWSEVIDSRYGPG